MQREHWLAAEFAAAALIGFGGIGEAVAEDDLAICQRGVDHLRDVLRARRKHQRQFRHRGKAVSCGIEQETPDFLPSRGSTGLASDNNRQALRAQYAGKFFELRAFAAAIEAFEGDETAAM